MLGRGLRAGQYFGGYSDHGATCQRFSKYNGATANDTFLADSSTWEHYGADSNMREWPDGHASTEDNARRDMNVRVDSAIVLDYRSAVNNAIFADDGPGVDDDSGHYNRSRSNACRRSNDGSRMNKNSGQEPLFERETKTPGASAVITYSDDEGAFGKAVQFPGSTYERAIAKREADLPRVVVQEQDALESSSAPGNVQNDLAVTPSAPN